MSTKCYICNTDKRIQRLSFHILKEHFNSLLTEENIESIKESITRKKGYTFIKISSLIKACDNLRVYVSFAFNSGWITNDNAHQANKEMSDSEIDKHIKVCKHIIDEYNKLEVKPTNNTITDDTTTNNTITDDTTTTNIKMKDLQNMFQKLQKKCDTLEKEKKNNKNEILTEHDHHYQFSKHLIRLLNIDEDKYGLYIEKYSDICEKYKDDDNKFEKAMKEMTLTDEY